MATNSTLTGPIITAVKPDGNIEDPIAIYDAITESLLETVFGKPTEDSKITQKENLQEVFDFFKPIFAGDGREKDQAIDWSYYNRLAKSVHENFATMSCFLEILEAVYELKFPLMDVIFEVIDPLHRPGSYLWKKYLKWDHQQDFFTWVDTSNPNYSKQVQYHLSAEEIEKLTATFEDGQIKLNGQIADSTDLDGKRPGHYAFAMLKDGRLLLRKHEKGNFQHSSFSSAAPVRCTGMIRIVKGKVTKASNHSGHFRGEKKDFRKVIADIPADCFADNADILIETNRAPNIRDGLVNSNSTWLKFFGHLSRDFISSRTVTLGKSYNQQQILGLYDGKTVYEVEGIDPPPSCYNCFDWCI